MPSIKTNCFLLLLFLSTSLLAQKTLLKSPAKAAKKIMGHEAFDLWKDIKDPMLSPNGEWAVYQIEPGEGDAELNLWHAKSGKTYTFERGKAAHFSADSRYLVFSIVPFRDTLINQRRRKVKEDKLPKDSLAILRLDNQQINKIPRVESFKLPEKWAGFLAYQLASPEELSKDSTQTDSLKTKPKKEKKETADTGHRLIIHQLDSQRKDTIPFVKSYEYAKEGSRFLLHSTGDDSTFLAGVYLYQCREQQLKPLWRGKGTYKKLSLDEQGQQAAFVADLDTSKARIRPFTLHFWQERMDSAQLSLSNRDALLPDGWRLSEHANLNFSKDGKQLFFSIQPPPVLNDTTLLPEEIVQVEVWSYTDPQLYPQQKVLLEEEQKRSYRCVLHTGNKQMIQLGNEVIPNIRTANEGQTATALGYSELPYLNSISWEGFPSVKDVYAIDLNNGQQKKVATKLKANPRLSPAAKYIYWFNSSDTVWQTYYIPSGQTQTISNNKTVPFYDELNDRPMLPSSYGIAGWTKDDEAILIYDRYDIWQIDPQGKQPAKNLTNGRAKKLTYRYIRLDPEKRYIDPKEDLLLHLFNHQTKGMGYARLSMRKGKIETLLFGPFNYPRRLVKASNADAILFSQQDFQTFPDLQYSSLNFKKPKIISKANPQQAEYAWGTIEGYQWTAPDGQQLQGLLVKPPNFDPNKKYPMIVNFYERSSDRLHQHRAPKPHRSTINYSFYANRGYLIFNPDVTYRVGYPGESALHAVVSGVGSLIDDGFVDRERIALQGHSWGGYQIAYILTKSNMFRCAESGAPVVNMTSAYGGIRWGSGLSRMFQYEHTQSRIGGTLWDYPLRYIENSPIFFADKVETPVLILHNDKDGAVPWYQGIEFFVALRRLGKKTWMLNYNNEPHWPVKRQNRKDFNRRMQEFFDHYLKDAPLPSWMQRGVPAIEKGIHQGLLEENFIMEK